MKRRRADVQVIRIHVIAVAIVGSRYGICPVTAAIRRGLSRNRVPGSVRGHVAPDRLDGAAAVQGASEQELDVGKFMTLKRSFPQPRAKLLSSCQI